jgi:hypothetical protein
VVASDYLVSFETNRYSVPFPLIGQTVELQREGETLRVFHRDRFVASHSLLRGKHQLRILPEHGPGAFSRVQRRRRSSPVGERSAGGGRVPDVEVRDLAVYERLAQSVAVAEMTP